MSSAGRSCPLHYRYGAAAIARAPAEPVETLYVVGGLCGNPFALRALEALTEREAGEHRVCFNGDFNWFNTNDADFRQINGTVLKHDVTLGNVEAEFFTPEDDAGCGCAYPDTVPDAVVERSNRIHARLKATARRHPDLIAQLEPCPLVRRYRVGDAMVGVVHGDANALAGWAFDAHSVRAPGERAALSAAFDTAGVNIFASSHTCLPVCHTLDTERVVINNGAAGMPNFAGTRFGIVTRISTRSAPVDALYGTVTGGVHVEALALPYDAAAWMTHFLRNWPAGSDAHVSYHQRMAAGPPYDLAFARPLPP